MWEKAKDAYKSASEFVHSMLQKCKEWGIATAEFVKDFVKSTWEKMKNFGITAKDFIKATYEAVKTSLKGKWNEVANFFRKL
jgi:Flp pilus assembly pilin Flp